MSDHKSSPCTSCLGELKIPITEGILNKSKLWQKEKLLVLSNFFFCYNVFKKMSAAEASESIYMKERVKTACSTIRSFDNIYIRLALCI